MQQVQVEEFGSSQYVGAEPSRGRTLEALHRLEKQNLGGHFFQTSYLIGLWSLCALNDVEFNLISLFQALVTLTLN
jgi:hypothetical protein